MNRVWLFRILGIVMLVIFAVMMWNLYANLVSLQKRAREKPPAAATSTTVP